MKFQTGNAVKLAHEFIAPVLVPGALAVDATAGNGHDTLFLARGVGPQGRVYAFDIQEEAIAQTKALLERHGLLDRVTLLAADHREMDRYVPPNVRAVMFNLGYLPGGDHRVVTRPSSTLEALQTALALLAPGGRISMVIYTGHPGGLEELRAVEDFAATVPPAEFVVLRISFWNRSGRAPVVFFLEKAGAAHEGHEAKKDS
ncbi:class I SAM-dependent methyltransferase [Desulfovirgula thermocuniculi]|uniref:class I SAM-dependent methyltransferase n=1 Tax=Desulfovirgula thermocuniculi TaxID=348842 RepID=UPI0003FB3C41|nr:class I SAM-dependent methyltransferase [Desulfovirgula thermocuniculi]